MKMDFMIIFVALMILVPFALKFALKFASWLGDSGCVLTDEKDGHANHIVGYIVWMIAVFITISCIFIYFLSELISFVSLLLLICDGV